MEHGSDEAYALIAQSSILLATRVVALGMEVCSCLQGTMCPPVLAIDATVRRMADQARSRKDVANHVVRHVVAWSMQAWHVLAG